MPVNSAARHAAFALAVFLSGCATTPRIVPLPSVCPAQRERPVMAELPQELPALADYLPANATSRQQSDALHYVRIESGRRYSECIVSRGTLIDWIRAE